MDKLKIGIPRGIPYYYYGNFWISFFKNLDIEVVVSSKTTKEIVEKGISIAPDEMCLSMKLYLGHVDYLKNKCDYILVPRIDRYDNENQTCTNFSALYDLVNHFFDISIINYNIDNHNDLIYGLIGIGKELKKDRIEVLKAYEKAIIEDSKYKRKRYKEQEEKLNSRNKKILIVSHAYNIHDEFIGVPISKMLEKNNLEVIYSNYFDPKITNKLSKKISKNLYWKYSRDSIGSIEMCEDIDGVVFVSTFPCGLDSLANEYAMRKIDKPYLNIIIDDLSSVTGLETRIESFVDLLG
jgi:Uncharacterized protein conserved in bacteria